MEEKLTLRLSKRANFFLALFTFVLYIMTLAPTYLWSDSAKLAIYVYEKNFIGTGTYVHGLHPMHSVLGYIFSLLPFPLAYSQNLMSAFFAAGTIYFLFKILLKETRNLLATCFACGALAVSHLFWLYAVINETYALVAFFLVLTFFLSLKWIDEKKPCWLYLTAFFFGMGFANHSMMILFLPGLIILLWGKPLLRFMASLRILTGMACFLIGASPIFLLPLLYKGVVASSLPSELTKASYSTYNIFGTGIYKFLKELVRYPAYLGYQFPTIGVLLGCYGFIGNVNRKRRLLLSTFVMWLSVLLFACQYFFQRQFPMFIPSFVIFSLWIGLGISLLLKRYPERNKQVAVTLFILLWIAPPLIYYSAYQIAEAIPIDLSFIRKLVYRNTYRYYLFPPKHRERGAEKYVENSFHQAKENAMILTDFNPGMALLYGQKVLGYRKDLKILVLIDDWVLGAENPSEEILHFLRMHVGGENSPLYLADNWEAYYHISSIEKEFTLKQEGGPLWEVLKKSDEN